jgi:hypothetical protein
LHQININRRPPARQSQKAQSQIALSCRVPAGERSYHGVEGCLRRLVLCRKDSSFALWRWTIIP